MMPSELEEFLRGAAQRRQPPKPPQASQAQLAAESDQQGSRQLGQLGQHPLAQRESSLGSRLGSEHLAQGVDRRDEQMEEHLHEVFDHKLGQLKHSTEPDTGTQRGTIAVQLSQLLSQPANIRQAVILAEVLRSPLERWEENW